MQTLGGLPDGLMYGWLPTHALKKWKQWCGSQY